MTQRRRSADWLSYNMARALAATGPPLRAVDVLSAAEDLSVQTPPAKVIGSLLRRGPDLPSARTIVEALRALQDYGR